MNQFRQFLATILGLALAALVCFGCAPSYAEETPAIQIFHLALPSSLAHDYAPQISPDGKYLIFQSNRPGPYEEHNLWFTFDKNSRDRTGNPDWTVPLPLRFPFFEPGTETMQVTIPPGTLNDPPGAFSVNTDGFEGSPFVLYRKGNPVEIYFTGKRELNRDGFRGLNIYFSRFRDQRWSVPEHLNVINSDFDDRMPYVSEDGKTMYFVSDRPGGYGQNDIWTSERNLKTGLWSRPINLGDAINTEANEIMPALSPNSGTFLFSSDRDGGFGHFDYYASFYNGYFWDAPKNLGEPFNTSRDDEGISFTHDGLWAYFASDRLNVDAKGDFDLYRIRVPDWLRESVEVLFTGVVLDGRTRKPLGIEATIHVHFEKETLVTTSRAFNKDSKDPNNFSIRLRTGRQYRVVVSAPGFHPTELVLDYKGNVPAKKIDRRTIILQPIKEEIPVDTTKERIVPGRVIDADTELGLPGASVVLQVEGKAPEKVVVDDEGNFALRLGIDTNFTIIGSADGYENASLSEKVTPDLKRVILKLKSKGGAPCPGEAPECIDNQRVYFDVDSAEIQKSEMATLEAIVKIMKKNPNLKIEIRGHTDQSYRGPKKDALSYNQRLSEKRAQAVLDALVKLGIAKERFFSVRGYSYLEPLATTNDAKKQRLNRRVEFRREKR